MDKYLGQGFFEAIGEGGERALSAVALLPTWILFEVCEFLLSLVGLEQWG